MLGDHLKLLLLPRCCGVARALARSLAVSEAGSGYESRRPQIIRDTAGHRFSCSDVGYAYFIMFNATYEDCNVVVSHGSLEKNSLMVVA